ncbi:MAG: hypothetical protein KAQ92_02270 [Candidatus Aenigmarchaeota archaeon]|nr:hypothetical protein [Candidatus Aenigmarchaeota archaeon]
MVFYNPISFSINSTPVIVYPCPGVEMIFNRKEKGCIEKYITELYFENNIHANGEYNIIILWNEDEEVMVDLWIFDRIESWGSGPLVDVKIFRDKKIDLNTGVSAGDGLVLLGMEEQHRWTTQSLKEYLRGKRPKLPKRISANEEFYF